MLCYVPLTDGRRNIVTDTTDT